MQRKDRSNVIPAGHPIAMIDASNFLHEYAIMEVSDERGSTLFIVADTITMPIISRCALHKGLALAIPKARDVKSSWQFCQGFYSKWTGELEMCN